MDWDPVVQRYLFPPAPVLNPPIVHLASPDEAGWLSHGVMDDVALCDGEISTRSASSPWLGLNSRGGLALGLSRRASLECRWLIFLFPRFTKMPKPRRVVSFQLRASVRVVVFEGATLP